MKNYLYINVLGTIGYSVLLVSLLLLVGCSATQVDMARVNQNLQENRLVPEAAVQNPDVLNQYHHAYPVPKQDLAIQVDFDRPNLVVQGGELFAQIALTTRASPVRPVNLHLLAYDESYKSVSKQLQQVLAQIRRGPGRPHRISFDAAFAMQTKAPQKSLFAHSDNESLLDFMLQTVMHGYGKQNHHFVLLLGDYGSLAHKEKQNIVDSVNILAAKGYQLSVISYAEKPDFVFLEKLAQNGKGRLALIDEFFDSKRWYAKEITRVNARHYRNIEVKLTSGSKSTLLSMLSPTNVEFSQHGFQLTIPEMQSGEQKVMLIKFRLAAMRQLSSARVVTVTLNYFDKRSGKYHQVRRTKSMNYVMDKNRALPVNKGYVARSKLILNTHRTIADVSHLINKRRNIQAIAELTRQARAISIFNQREHDDELARDAVILKKYANRLAKFDSSWFQSVVIWRDLNRDNARFAGKYD